MEKSKCDLKSNQNVHEKITGHCLTTDSKNPLDIAENLMDMSEIRMHGPEHHYLIAACLMTAYCNFEGLELDERLKKARIRSEKILPGECGFYGVCGGVRACGIFLSILWEVTPLSGRLLQRLNEFTAKCHNAMADNTGPRCCKRAVFTIIQAAVDWINRQPDMVRLEKTAEIICKYSPTNPDCIKEKCEYWKKIINKNRDCSK